MSPGLGQFKDGPEQRAPVPPLEVLTSALSRSFGCKRQDKVLEEVLQGHVASDHGWLSTLSGLGRSGGNEPDFEAIGGCVHERRALNTRLSSGTSAGTFAVSAGPYRNYQAEAGTKNEPDTFFCTSSKKGLENRSSRFEPKISWIPFSRGSGPPLIVGWLKRVPGLSEITSCWQKNWGNRKFLGIPESCDLVSVDLREIMLFIGKPNLNSPKKTMRKVLSPIGRFLSQVTRGDHDV